MLIRALKKSRPILMIVLFVQAISMFFLFLTQVGKRKSLADAFLALSATETAASIYLLVRQIADHKEKKLCRAQKEAMEEDPEGFEIPLDKTASEKDFR